MPVFALPEKNGAIASSTAKVCLQQSDRRSSDTISKVSIPRYLGIFLDEWVYTNPAATVHVAS